MSAKALLADKGYDSNAVVELARASGMEAIIPSRSNRKLARLLDSTRYIARHLVENFFQRMKITYQHGLETSNVGHTRQYKGDVLGLRCNTQAARMTCSGNW